MNTGDLNKVWETRALKRKDRQDEATKMLDRIAKQVQPIMRNHKWRVKLLSEMCPTNPRLLGLNVNRGVHVKLRLRRPNRDLDFYPFDQVLDTMLHELCHNVHGPHDAKFYKLWDELRKECEELMAKGVTGTAEGFDLPGKRLGSVMCQPPLSSLRKTALAAAEKRAVLGSLMPSGPRRLGGDSSMMAALSPVQAAAMAAERRLQDDIWCGSAFSAASEDGECNSGKSEDCENIDTREGSSRIHNGAKAQPSGTLPQKRSRTPTNTSSQSSKVHLGFEFVDLSSYDSVSGAIINSDIRSQKRSRESETNSFPLSDHHHQETNFVDLLGVSTSGSGFINGGTHDPGESAMWQCGTCTLLNSPLAPICELCSAQRPKDVGTSRKIWSCKFCTLENSVKLEKCSACGEWRYSHGPPIATRPPNLGT
ncbi:uncharacterized protein LOC126788046 [Argentina anserina]|uniref:uncharacterized protein LOC126788046 n=1 Tax=Argentina anserina TaxID=57926 RepID=UPI0021768F8E|nr:uncharacterized protein LOC126788046 [Potentilla anserina]